MAEHLELDPINTGEAPAISARSRTLIYVGSLAVNIATIVVLGLAVVFDLLPPVKAFGAGTVILAGLNLLSSGLGVAYRPTRAGVLQ